MSGSSEIPKNMGRYEIVRELGRGAMGVVYEGRDPNIGRRVAIKTMRRDVMESSGRAEEMLERFLREAQAAGLLNHPNIITIYDAGEEGDTTYIAMEFVEGASLRDLLDKKRHFDAEEIAEIGATICDALAAAHEQGIVHRDIKPDNILLPEKGPLKVADFGIARVSNSNLTQDGELIGTPYYMSPEQFMGQKLDGRSDLFSTAVILYEMLTNEKPFMGEALTTMMHNVINTSPIPPQKLNFNVPTLMGEVVMKALSKRAADRYSDGHAMARALRECVKPNPDISVVGVAPDSNATVLSSSGLGAGATIISDMQAPPASLTMSGAPPAASLVEELSQGERQHGGLEEDTVARAAKTQGGLNMPLFAGVAILILVLGTGGYFAFSGGGGEGGGGGGTSGGTQAVTPITETRNVNFRVYGTEDSDTHTAYNDLMQANETDLSRWKSWEDAHIATLTPPITDARVTLTHNKTGESQVLEGTTQVPVPKNLADYAISVDAPGYMNAEYTFLSGGEISDFYILLRRGN